MILHILNITSLDFPKRYFFWGAAYCSPLLLLLDVIILCAFFISYLRVSKKTGWKIDYWHFFIILNYILPYFLIYPFAAHPLNKLAVGHFYNNIIKYIDSVFLLHVFGFCMILLGSEVYKIITYNCKKVIVFNSINKVEVLYSRIIKNDSINNFLLGISLLFFAIIILVLITSGAVLTNPRDFFLNNRSLNPIFLLGSKIISLGAFFSTLRAIHETKKRNIIFIIIYIILSLIAGTRSATIGIILNYIIFWSYKNYKLVKLKYIFITVVTLLFLVFIMGIIRHGGNLTNILFRLGELIYGNNFSDLRDSAWFFSAWDNELVLGKNYLADFLVFIPSSISEFRQEWSYGFYTVTTAFGSQNLDHAGLRIGFFGEIYANFGIIGVSILGLIIGFVLRWIDQRIKSDIIQKNDIILAASRPVLLGVIVSIGNSAGLFLNLYINLFIIISLGLFIQLTPHINKQLRISKD